MNTLHTHYQELLGLDSTWKVEGVHFRPKERKVIIKVVHLRKSVKCPECGKSCSIADHAPGRTWRHLDTMQFETCIESRTPRSNCANCGVKTTTVPWAEKHSRFTFLFEVFVIRVIESCTTISNAQDLTCLSWDTLNSIMKRAVKRGLAQRELEDIEYLGIDEKQFRSGHDYISCLNDLSGGRVLHVVEGRKKEATEILLKKIPETQRLDIKAVAIDLWKAYIGACKTVLPNADIVHDRFHISKYLNDAVDKVRKSENRRLNKVGDTTLIGSKYCWLRNPENMDAENWLTFSLLKEKDLKTSRAWAIKENFRWFWEYTYTARAKSFFKDWYNWAIRSQLTPIKEVAKSLKKHFNNIITYFKHRITNAVSEGLNSRIQTIKAAARGFHSFENFRIRILFFCGKLNLYPEGGN